MPDRLTIAQRSYCMSRVKGKDTSLEKILRSELHKRGFRYRKNVCGLPGKPDIVFVTARVAVFVDGCFWHGCPIHGSIPATNKRFWKKKLARNMERDREVTEMLTGSGWLVMRFWTHELKDDLDKVVRNITKEVLKRK